MSSWNLLQMMRNHLQPPLESLLLPVRGRTATGCPVKPEHERVPSLRCPKIFLGAMPPTIKDAMESVPFVVVQALDGFDVNGLHRVRVALRLCIVGDDLEEGEEDLQNFISTLRLSLLSLPDGLLNGRFRMVEDEQGRLGFWERPDEQAYPFLQAHIFTTWEMQGVTNVTV